MNSARTSNGGTVTATPTGFRLWLPAGSRSKYRLAQLDDYARLPRRSLPQRPAVLLELRARASSAAIPGTWGFGLWNDSLGVSLGFGGRASRAPVLPNAAWFFHASPQNHLSLRDDKPAHGFLAQAFCSTGFDPQQVAAALVFPFSAKKARQMLGRLVQEDSAVVIGSVTQWHRYRIEWGAERASFRVDDVLCLETRVSPRPPLGLVVWIDNQYAAYPPDGRLRWGLEQNPSAVWLEVEGLRLTAGS